MKENNISMEFNETSEISPLSTTIVESIEFFAANATAEVPLVYDTIRAKHLILWILAPISILIASCLFLNLTIVVVIALQRNLHKPTNAYICSLACIDFFGGCIPMVSAAIYNVFQEYRVGTAFCLTTLMAELLVKVCALNHLLLLAYDRYCAVMNPLRYSMPSRRRFIAMQIAGAYVVTVIVWGPPVILYTRITEDGFCYLALPINYEFGYFISTTVALYGAFVYLYARCVWGIRTQFFRVHPIKGIGHDGGVGRITINVSSLPRTNTSSLANKNTVEIISTTQDENSTTVTDIGTGGQVETPSPPRSSPSATRPRIQQRGASDQVNKRRNDLVRSLRNVGVYVLVFTILYMPYIMVRITFQVCIMVYKDICIANAEYVYSVTAWLVYAHSAVHPALYIATQREFRASLRALVRKWRKFACR